MQTLEVKEFLKIATASAKNMNVLWVLENGLKVAPLWERFKSTKALGICPVTNNVQNVLGGHLVVDGRLETLVFSSSDLSAVNENGEPAKGYQVVGFDDKALQNQFEKSCAVFKPMPLSKGVLNVVYTAAKPYVIDDMPVLHKGDLIKVEYVNRDPDNQHEDFCGIFAKIVNTDNQSNMLSLTHKDVENILVTCSSGEDWEKASKPGYEKITLEQPKVKQQKEITTT